MPGPEPHTSAAAAASTSTAGTGLYRDVLQHIFTFLEFREFVRTCTVHPSWYAAGCSMKPRKEQFEFAEIDRIGAFWESPLRSHINQLSIEGEYPELNRLLYERMSQLETLILFIRIDQLSMPLSAAASIYFPLPPHLRDLSIDFELWDGCDLTVESGACVFIAECLKQIAAQSAHLLKLDMCISKAFGDMECPHDVPNLPTLTWIRFPRQFRLNSTIDLIKSFSSLRCWRPSFHLDLGGIQRLVGGSDLGSPPSMLEDIGGLWNVNEAMSNHLRRLKNLTQLDFTWFELEDPMTLFPHFPRLTSVDLTCVPSVNVDHLARALSACVSVTDLRINHMYLTSDHMSLFLPHLISLTELKLYGCDSVVSLQFLTTSQTSLKNLRRFEISQSAQMPISEFAHHLPAISKSLEYLLINNAHERFDPSTIAHWTPGSSEFSRADWPRLKVFNLHQPKTLNEILGFEPHPPETPSSATVPAPPLVGVETNPGPPSASTSISTVLTQTPQNLFTNGLHLVYLFLDTSDWLASLKTCGHWYRAASSEPSRHIRIGMSVIQLLPPRRLIHHITSLESSHSDCTFHVTEAQLLDIFHSFPFLEQIGCTPIPNKVEAVSWTQLEALAKHSRHLDLYLNFCDYPSLILAIRHITSLTSLTIEEISVATDWSGYQTTIPSLVNLQILSIQTEEDFLSTPGSSSTIGLTILPPSLTRLDFNRGRHSYRGCYMSQIQLPNLESLALHSADLQLGELGQIYDVAPNLLSLKPFRFCLNRLVEEFSAFKNVRSITFTTKPKSIGVNLDSDCESIVTRGLASCPSLTELEFGRSWMLSESTSWLQLCQSLTNLRKLVIGSWTERTNRGWWVTLFAGFTHLDELIINDHFQGKGVEFIDFKCFKWHTSKLTVSKLAIGLYPPNYVEFRRDENQQLKRVMPSTSTFGSSQAPTKQHKSVARVEIQPETPPAARLVGIETNPGPLSSSTPFAQTLFLDGLLLIYQYLSFSDLLPALHSCQYWYSCGLKVKSRRLKFQFNMFYPARTESSQIQYCRLMQSSPFFRHHIGSITNLSIPLILAIKQFEWPDHLTTLHCVFNEQPTFDVGQSQPQLPAAFNLPPALTSITVNIYPNCRAHQFCQAFTNRLLTVGTSLMHVKWIYKGWLHQYDLSPLLQLPHLTDCDLEMNGSFYSSTHHHLCAQLPLTKFRLLTSPEVNRPDWSVFHANSPLMFNIQDWNWVSWVPQLEDWNYLARNRPPKLQSLTIWIQLTHPIVGLSDFNLTSLTLTASTLNTETNHSCYVPIVSACQSLKRLTLILSRLTMSELGQILRSLKGLEYCSFSHHSSFTIDEPCPYLPRHIVFDNVRYASLQTFTDSIIQAKQTQIIEVQFLDFGDNDPFASLDPSAQQSRLEHLCLTLKSLLPQLMEMRIERINHCELPFHYSRLRCQSVMVESKDVPTKRLVGIETNPGPFASEDCRLGHDTNPPLRPSYVIAAATGAPSNLNPTVTNETTPSAMIRSPRNHPVTIQTRMAPERPESSEKDHSVAFLVTSWSALPHLPSYLHSTCQYYYHHRSQARTEILSGISLCALTVPEGIAFALLAGMEPSAGLYSAALLPIVVGSLTGQPGTISAAAGATGALIQHLTDESGPLSHLATKADRQQFVAPVLLLCGGLQFLCAFFGVSKLLCLLPHTALMGFMNALSIIIAISQFHVFKYCSFGEFELCSDAEQSWLPLNQVESWLAIIHVLLAMGVMTYAPKIPKIGRLVPGSFAALLVSIAVEEGIFRAGLNIQSRNIGETAKLPTSLPTFNSPILPAGSTSGDIGILIQYAVTLTAVSLIESVINVKLMCRLLNTSITTTLTDRECAAQACGNVISSLFGAQGGCGIIGESRINILNGARGRLSVISSGVFMFFTIGVAGPIVSRVPIAGLGGVLFVMVLHMFDWSTFQLLRYGRVFDCFIVLLVSVLGCVWNLAFAVLIGSALTACEYAYQSNNLLQITVQTVNPMGTSKAASLTISPPPPPPPTNHTLSPPLDSPSSVTLSPSPSESSSLLRHRGQHKFSTIATDHRTSILNYPEIVTTPITAETTELTSMAQPIILEHTSGDPSFTALFSTGPTTTASMTSTSSGQMIHSTNEEVIQPTDHATSMLPTQTITNANLTAISSVLPESTHYTIHMPPITVKEEVQSNVSSTPSTAEPSISDTTSIVMNEYEPSLPHSDHTSPLKSYRLVGPFAYCHVSDLMLQFDAVNDPPHILIDFTSCHLMDHSALIAVYHLLQLYQEKKKNVSEVGFRLAAQRHAPPGRDWTKMLGTDLTFYNWRDVSTDASTVALSHNPDVVLHQPLSMALMDSSPTTVGSPTTSPAPSPHADCELRLVGIETNPGPVVTTITPHTAVTSPLTAPTLQTLFVDGILLILGYLSFGDALSGLHTCRYWYACGLKEKSRSLTVNMVTLSKNSHGHSFWSSSHRFHIGTIHHLSISDVHLLQQFTHLHTCSCSNQLSGLTTPAAAVADPPIRLPASLTSLSVATVPTKRLTGSDRITNQRLISILPTGQHLTQLILSFPRMYEIDLTPLKDMPSLTDLYLSCASPQPICAQLSLKRFKFIYLDQIDFRQFHPNSKFMLSIGEWDWCNWTPTVTDWQHLSTNPPPQLRTLTMNYASWLPPLGLSSFRHLTHLTLSLNGSHDINYLPHLYQCRSLTYLSIHDITRLVEDDVHFMGAPRLDDTHLCQLLESLTQLDELEFDNYYPLHASHSLQLLSRKVKINLLQVKSFPELTKYLLQATRLQMLDIRYLCGFDGQSIESVGPFELIQLCQSMPILQQMRIKVLNRNMMDFEYDKAIHVQLKDVPQPRLVGIETNPGPVVTTTTPTPTPRTLFVDGLLSIFRCLTLSDLLPALHSCHYWYECGLKERCRQLNFSVNQRSKLDLNRFDRLLVLADSPLRFHITGITEMNLCHLLAIKQLNRFPNLHTCEFFFEGTLANQTEQFRRWNSESTMLDPNEFPSTFQLPHTLRRLKIRVTDSDGTCTVTTDLCQSLMNCIAESSITEFEFNTDYDDRHYDLSPIGQAPQLTSLKLRLNTPLTKQNQGLLAGLSLHQFSIVVESPPDWTIIHPSSPLMLSIRFWLWYDSQRQNHYLHLLKNPPPNITQLQHSLTNHEPVVDFTVFPKLSQLSLSIAWRADGLRADNEEIPELYTTVLCRCLSMTHLHLDGDIFLDSQLCRILIALKDTLQMLEVYGNDHLKPINEALGHLPPITTLETLRLHRFESLLPTLSKSTRAKKLKISALIQHEDDLNFPLNDADFRAVCHQRLSHIMQPGFTLDLKEVWSAAGEEFSVVYVNPTPPHTSLSLVQSTAIQSKDVPAERLVCIEMNPGPSASITSHAPTAQTLFVDGLLSIFTYLSLADVLPAFQACHSWYSCSLKEKSRQLEANLSNSTGVHDRHQSRGLPLIFNSRLKYHVTSLANVSIRQLFALYDLHLDHLKKIDLLFTRENSTLTSSSPNEPPPVVILPTSLTSLNSLQITIFSKCTVPHLIQSLINSIPRSGSPIEHFKFRSYLAHHFDLTSLAHLRSLSHLELFSHRGLVPPDQILCASLSLRRFASFGLGPPDWTVCHPQSPLMMRLEELDWYDWNPSESDWAHLARHPPPHLHTLTIQLYDQIQSLSGLPSLSNIQSLTIGRIVGGHINLPELHGDQYVNILTQCRSLNFLQLENSILADDQLSKLLISTHLDQLKLSGRFGSRYSQAWTHLPPHTIIHQLTVSELRVLFQHLSQAKRIATITIHDLFSHGMEGATVPNHILYESIRVLCQEHGPSGSQPFRMEIKKLNSEPFNFIYQQLAHSVEPPAKSLIGIEPNPGPFGSPPLAQTLFVDGVLSIFGFLPFSDLIPAVRTCHYWYSCGLKERTRHLHFEWQRLEPFFSQVIESPMRIHLGSLSQFPVKDAASFSQLKELRCLQEIRCVLDEDARNESLWESFILPASLITLKIVINMRSTAHNLCQSLIDRLPTATPQLTYLDFGYFCLNPEKSHHFDFSSLAKLSSLAFFKLPTIPKWSQQDQMVCANLPLKTLISSGSPLGSCCNRPDWTIFHYETPFMRSIQEWHWGDWIPTEVDWQHLIAHPPPKLHTLTMKYDATQPMSLLGLSTFNLHTLTIFTYYDMVRQHQPSRYSHLLTPLQSLTSLTLSDPRLIDEELKKILSELKLDRLQIGSHSSKFVSSLKLLPRHSTLHRLSMERSLLFTSNLSQAKQLKVLHIDHLLIPDEILFCDQFDLLDRFCQMIDIQQLTIDSFNSRTVNFKFVKAINSHPPAPQLVGIETNPGPFRFNYAAILLLILITVCIAMQQFQDCGVSASGVGEDGRSFHAPDMVTFQQFSQSIQLLPSNRKIDRVDRPSALIPAAVTAEQFSSVMDAFIEQQRLELLDAVWFQGKRVRSDVPFLQRQFIQPGDKAVFFGDFHGDIKSLLAMMDDLINKGYLSQGNSFHIKDSRTHIIFLGDYTDRGLFGLEVIFSILRLKLENPNQVWMIRGNHEDTRMNERYGFLEELERKYGEKTATKLFHRINELYDLLPVGLFLGTRGFQTRSSPSDYLLCVHGGGEFGFDHAPFLTDGSSQFVAITDVARKKNLKKLSRQVVAEIRQHFPSSLLQDQSVFETHLGYQWTDFEVNPTGHAFYNKGRGMTFNKKLTKEYLAWKSGVDKNATFQLRGIFRGHQHSTGLTPMMKLLLNRVDKKKSTSVSNAKNLGVAKLWTDNSLTKCMPKNYDILNHFSFHCESRLDYETYKLWDDIVVTFLVSPDTIYGESHQYSFGTYGILTVGNQFNRWRLKVNQVIVSH